jgi:hypothetical protein
MALDKDGQFAMPAHLVPDATRKDDSAECAVNMATVTSDNNYTYHLLRIKYLTTMTSAVLGFNLFAIVCGLSIVADNTWIVTFFADALMMAITQGLLLSAMGQRGSSTCTCGGVSLLDAIASAYITIPNCIKMYIWLTVPAKAWPALFGSDRCSPFFFNVMWILGNYACVRSMLLACQRAACEEVKSDYASSPEDHVPSGVAAANALERLNTDKPKDVP